MKRINRKRIAVLLLCIGFSYLLSAAIRNQAHGAIRATDFGAVYYGARCAVEHKDPYNPQIVLREFKATSGRFSDFNKSIVQAVVTKIIYPPTAFLVVAPLAKLPWTVARTTWLGLVAGLLVLAAYLMWDLAAEAPKIAGGMVGFILLNCVILLVSGNPVGVVAPACAISAWCLLKERNGAAGVALLALGLMLKPHDAGFVWLYFLLAGGACRKRALQALAVTALLGICAVIWIAPTSPHWIAELRSNVAELSARGGPADPGPSGVSTGSFSPIISLQGAVSILDNNPNTYNDVSYLIAGCLILVWVLAVLRKPLTPESRLLALGSISVLTLLPVYHRADDAKMLLFLIPAFAMLWAGRGAKRWFAVGLTAAAIFVTSADPILLVNAIMQRLVVTTSTLGEKVMLLCIQPAPVILLATGSFYLWAFIDYQPESTRIALQKDSGRRPAGVSAI